MRVLQINAVYGVGSTGVIVEDIHKLCLSHGIDSFVAYSSSSLPPQDIPNGYLIGSVIGKKLHALLCRINGMQAYFSRFTTRKLLKYIDTINPDIVHLHNLHSNYINLNMLLRYLAKRDIKTVVTLHDCWFYTGGCFHYTAAGCDKWLEDCGDCPKKHLDTPAYFFDRSKKILRDRKKYFGAIKDLTVVGVSQWIADEAARTFLDGRKTQTVYNGIDTHFFKAIHSDFRSKYALEDKFVILGPASKWLAPVNKKTFDTVVSGLDNDCVLVLIGCNGEQQLPSNVISIPFIKDREELRKVYSAADVFVNCTREESLSLINVEAQACGTPVITYANTGVKETVDNKCGFSVKTGDATALLEAIKSVKSRTGEALSNACRRFVSERFDRDANYMKYINLYLAEKDADYVRK